MTHNQALAGKCAGHMVSHASYPTRNVTPAGIVDLVITEYECEGCGQAVIVERVFDAESITVRLAVHFAFGVGAPVDGTGPAQRSD